MKLQAKELESGYDKRTVLAGVDIEVKEREIVGVIGSNGSGKSTLLKTLAQLLKPRSGTVYLDGKALQDMSTGAVARSMAGLPQAPLSPAELTVRELVGYGRYPHAFWLKRLGPADHDEIDRAIYGCRLGDMDHRHVNTLSGGERQRFWLAMALAQEPSLMLFDEPVTFLDINHQLEFMGLIAQLNAERGITVLMVLHDLNLASRYCERLIAVNHGRIFCDGPTDEVIRADILRSVFNVDVYIVRNPHTGRSVCYPY